MIEIAIPNFEAELRSLEEIGSAGFVMGFGLRYGQPDYFLNRYPKKWTDEYEAENYFFGDPVAVWTIAREGMVRWSAVSFPDIRRIMPAAAKHGLRYGATFVTKTGVKRSFLSLARPDRELTDDEMKMLMAKIESWAALFNRARVALTDGELEALKAIQSGLRQNEAAAQLGLSISGLKLRLEGAQKKLGVRTITRAVAQAVRMNLI